MRSQPCVQYISEQKTKIYISQPTPFVLPMMVKSQDYHFKLLTSMRTNQCNEPCIRTTHPNTTVSEQYHADSNQNPHHSLQESQSRGRRNHLNRIGRRFIFRDNRRWIYILRLCCSSSL